MPVQELTRQPTILAGLQAGKRYRGEVRSNVVVYFEASASAPAADSQEGSTVRPTDAERRFEIDKTAAAEVWVWAGDGLEPAGTLQYDEVDA